MILSANTAARCDMKRLISVIVLIAVSVGVFCSACSSDANKNNGDYIFSPENFFGNAVHSLFPNKIFDTLFSTDKDSFNGEISVTDMYFSDAETGEKHSYQNVLQNSFDAKIDDSGFVVHGNANLGSKDFEFSSLLKAGAAKGCAYGLLDEDLTVDFFNLYGVSELSAVYSDLKNGYSDFVSVVTDGMNSAEATDEEISLDSENDGRKMTKTTYTLGKESSVNVAEKVIDTVYSDKNTLGSIFGRYFLNLYNIDSDNYARYGENLKNAVVAADDFAVTIEKYLYKGNIARIVITSSSSDSSVCRRLTYSCSSEDKASLVYENPSSGMPLFSAELSDGTYTFSFNNAYTVSFAYQTPSEKMNIELTVHTLSLSEAVFFNISFDTSSDKITVNADLHDENGSFGGKLSISAVKSEPANYEIGVPDGGYIIENSMAGALGYDKFAEVLVSEFPGIEKIIPTDIAVSSDFGNVYAATIGEDRYSLAAYLYYLQQSRDACEYVAAEILVDEDFSSDDMWKIVLSGGKTLEEYGYSLTEENYISSYYIIKYFNENGLSLSLKEFSAIKNTIDSLGKDTVSQFCARLGCTEKELRYLYSVSYMQSKVFADIYGEAGKTPVTVNDVKALFDASYAGVRFVTLFNFDPSDSSSLDSASLEKVKERAKECFKKLTTGEISMDDAIREYSDAYKYVQTDGDRDSSEYFVGTLVGKDGKSDAFTFPTDMISALFDLKVGEFGYFEDSESGFWVFERIGTDDKFSDYKDTLRDSLLSELQTQALSTWRASQKYSLDKSVISEYNIKSLPSVFVQRTSDDD